jgi:hypothetical protein
MRWKRPARRSIGLDLDPAIIEAWQGVEVPGLTVQCGDAVRFLSRYSFTGSELVYLDPPYLMETRSHKGKLYRFEMTEGHHRELLAVIKKIPARVIVSGYWSRLYGDELKGWRTVSFPAVKRSGEVATEWLWMNYSEPLELHDYSFLGADFRERERIKRKRQRWEKKLRAMPALERYAILTALEAVRGAGALALPGDSSGGLGVPDDGIHHRQF